MAYIHGENFISPLFRYIFVGDDSYTQQVTLTIHSDSLIQIYLPPHAPATVEVCPVYQKKNQDIKGNILYITWQENQLQESPVEDNLENFTFGPSLTIDDITSSFTELDIG